VETRGRKRSGLLTKKRKVLSRCQKDANITQAMTSEKYFGGEKKERNIRAERKKRRKERGFAIRSQSEMDATATGPTFLIEKSCRKKGESDLGAFAATRTHARGKGRGRHDDLP